jgi:hypothetical protein
LLLTWYFLIKILIKNFETKKEEIVLEKNIKMAVTGESAGSKRTAEIQAFQRCMACPAQTCTT